MELVISENIRSKIAMALPTSSIVPKSNFVTKSFKSMDKTLGQGSKSLTPKAMATPQAIKNPVNAFSTTKGFNNTNSGLGYTKLSSYNGDTMNKNILSNAYDKGVYDAITKVAMPGQMQQMQPSPEEMQMQQQQMQQQQMQQQQMQQQQMQQQQVPPTEAPVAEPMMAVQQDMAAMQPAPEGQPSSEELQQVQDSGITSGDIASAAKVIQTMAEMKANADMAGIQPMDQAAPGQAQPQA